MSSKLAIIFTLFVSESTREADELVSNLEDKHLDMWPQWGSSPLTGRHLVSVPFVLRRISRARVMNRKAQAANRHVNLQSDRLVRLQSVLVFEEH